jgi:ATP-binding protein involved in chromosome partitioning
LTSLLGVTVPLLGSVPIDPRLREGGDTGVPIVLAQPESAAAQSLVAIAQTLGQRTQSLVGRPLSLTPVS